jgi:hypothetical protein
MAYLKQEEDDEALQGSDAGSAGTAAGTGASPAPASAGSPNRYTQSNFTSGRMILNKNQDAALPDLGKGFNQKADERAKAIGDASTAYGQKAQGAADAYKFDDTEINKAVGGDTGAFSKIGEALRGPKAIDKFQAKPNLDIQDINKLNTAAGVSGELQKNAQERGDFNYGRGQSALDAQIFGRSDLGRKAQVGANLAKRQEVGQLADQTTAANENLRQAMERQMADNYGSLRQNVVSRQNAINSAAEAQAGSAAAGLAANQASRDDALYQDALKKIRERAQKEAGTAENYGEFNEGGKENPQEAMLYSIMKQALDKNRGKFAIAKSPTDKRMYNEEQAAQFNRINSLLGGDQPLVSAIDPNSYKVEDSKQIDRLIENALKNRPEINVPKAEKAKDQKVNKGKKKESNVEKAAGVATGKNVAKKVLKF